MITWYRQEHSASCVSACVRMVVHGFGQEFEEIQIRELLGNPRFGLTLTQAQKKLLEIGAVAEWNDDWNINGLRDSVRNEIYPIVGIERSFFGHQNAAHAVVVTNVQSSIAEFLDPLSNTSNPINTNPETFISAWETSGRETLIILSSTPKI